MLKALVLQSTMTRIKERSRRKAAMNDRKSALSQARMKSIASLAADDRVPKKRRKVGGGEFKLFLTMDLLFSLLQRICLERMTRIG